MFVGRAKTSLFVDSDKDFNERTQKTLSRLDLKNCFSHPRHIKKLMEDGTSLIAVPVKLSSFKLLIFPKFSGRLASFEHPKRMSISRDLRLSVLLGRLIRDWQNSKFKTVSLLSCPIDGWILTKLLQPRRHIFSSLGTPVKLGVLIRSMEYSRLMTFNLSKYCQPKKKRIISFHY